jgi:hypothetical protein
MEASKREPVEATAMGRCRRSCTLREAVCPAIVDSIEVDAGSRVALRYFVRGDWVVVGKIVVSDAKMPVYI